MKQTTFAERRRTPRYPASFRVHTETVDPVRDPITGERCFQTSDEDRTVDVSRSGLRLHTAHAPNVGTRLLVHIEPSNDDLSIDLVACTRWTRVELVKGRDGRLATCGVGVEVLGGSRNSLDRYERLLSRLDRVPHSSVAGGDRLG